MGRSVFGLRNVPRFSYSPVAMSSRMICEPSEFFTQALPSTFDAATEKCDCCVASRCHSLGIGYMRKVSDLRSNLASPVWYMRPTQRLPS